MIVWLLALLIVAVLLLLYVWRIRPLLRSRPAFKEFYDQEESLWGAIRLKTMGLKQRFFGDFAIAAMFIVEIYDFLAPLVASSGIDTTKIAPMIPETAWPVINIVILALMQWLRSLGDRRAAADIQIAAETGRVPENTIVDVVTKK